MSDMRCYQAPLLDLLRSVPIDGWATHENGEGVTLSYHMMPYGHYCHEAADEIERLREELLAALKNEAHYAKRIEELKKHCLEQENAVFSWALERHITDAQIYAAWAYVGPAGERTSAEDALEELGIVRCEGCRGSGREESYPNPNDDMPQDGPCPDCDGHRWVIGGEDE